MKHIKLFEEFIAIDEKKGDSYDYVFGLISFRLSGSIPLKFNRNDLDVHKFV